MVSEAGVMPRAPGWPSGFRASSAWLRHGLARQVARFERQRLQLGGLLAQLPAASFSSLARRSGPGP
jgi:hypothetical protein